MTLIDSINLWQIKNDDKFYFESMDIDERIDKHYLFDLIVTQYMNMQVLYADTKLYHRTVELFFLKNKDRISKLLDTIDLKYNPIENYSATENGTSIKTGNKNSNLNNEDKHYVSAYNNVAGEDVLSTRDASVGSENTNTGEDEATELKKSGLVSSSYQELIDKERKTALFDIDDFILKEFAKELLISIW